jgi:hypothetical protein
MENGHLVHLKWTWEVQAKLNTMVEKYTSHQQKVKLVSENGPHPPILLHIVHKYFELFILNLPPCFKGFNDVITSTRYLKSVLSLGQIDCTYFFHIGPLDYNRFDSF